MNFLGFGQSAEIDIIFDGAETRKTVEVKGEDGKMEKLYLYYDGETVSGKVNVTLKKPGSKLEHQGIKIEFIGQIELFYDRGNHHEFKGIVKALARPGDLLQNTSYPFEFPNVEKSFETYAGSNVRLRYFLRATIVRRISDITREVDIAVHTLCSYPDLNNPIKMEVGIEDCLHIEFEYNKSKYHLKDVIVGKIYFLLVRIKIKHMEIAIIKRESTGSGPNMFTENETIAKYEIMDGAPVKGESIPIRVFLAGYSLTPTMRDINKKFSVKYFLNLVLMDTEDRRYFKQQEITLWRKADKTRKSQSLHSSSTTASNHPNPPTHLVGSGHDSDLQSRYGIVGNMTNATGIGSSIGQNSGGIDGDTNATIDEINSGIGGDGQRSGETESTMGLFIRESPQQEYAQHEESPTMISPSSPRSPIGRATAEMLRGTADGAASNSAQNDGGSRQQTTSPLTTSAATVGAGAAATTTPTSTSQFIFESQSAVMVSTTPPPLPTTSITNDDENNSTQQQTSSSSFSSRAAGGGGSGSAANTAKSSRLGGSAAVEFPNVPSSSPAKPTKPTIKAKPKLTPLTATATSNDDKNDNDIMEEEMINVPLNSGAFESTKIIKRKSHSNDNDGESDD